MTGRVNETHVDPFMGLAKVVKIVQLLIFLNFLIINHFFHFAFSRP